MDSYKKKVEQEIVNTIIKGLKENTLTEVDSHRIATFVLEGVDKISNHNELIGFLSLLSIRWPIFSPIAQMEEGKLKRVVEKKTAQDVLKLISQNQIGSAIKLAQGVTES